MTIGSAAVVLYWVIFTILRGFAPKVNRLVKANMYDRKGSNEEAKKTAERMYYPIQAAKWLIKIGGWIETILLIALIAWIIYFIGAVMTGGVILFGYPV